MLSDLRESGAIEQDADIVIFLYRDDYYNPDSEKKNVAEVILAKHRGGSTGTVDLAWLPSYTKFANLDRRFFEEPWPIGDVKYWVLKLTSLTGHFIWREIYVRR